MSLAFRRATSIVNLAFICMSSREARWYNDASVKTAPSVMNGKAAGVFGVTMSEVVTVAGPALELETKLLVGGVGTATGVFGVPRSGVAIVAGPALELENKLLVGGVGTATGGFEVPRLGGAPFYEFDNLIS